VLISDPISSGSRKLAIQQNNATGIYSIAPIAFYHSNVEECLEKVPTYVNEVSDNFIFYCPSNSTQNNRYSLFGHQCAGIKTLFLLVFSCANFQDNSTVGPCIIIFKACLSHPF
jgi:hypothetical protein